MSRLRHRRKYERFNMTEEDEWQFVLVNGEYERVKFGYFIMYENRILILKLRRTLFKVSIENETVFLTKNPRLEFLIKLWKEIKRDRVDFYDVPFDQDETNEEAMKRELPPDVYKATQEHPERVIILDRLRRIFQL